MGDARHGLRRGSVLATLLTVSLAASGCGGVDASAAPTDATTLDFCMTLMQQGIDAENLVREVVQTVRQTGEIPADEDLADSVNDLTGRWVDGMLDVGTPADMPAAARSGFEDVVEELDEGLPDDVDVEELADISEQDLLDELSTEEFDANRALETYIGDTCTALWAERGYSR